MLALEDLEHIATLIETNEAIAQLDARVALRFAAPDPPSSGSTQPLLYRHASLLLEELVR